MAIKALVMSPLHNLGLTSVSALIAHGVTFHGKSSLLMYTDESNPLPGYMSLEEVEDPTRSVVQAEKLLRQKALDVDELLQYTHDFARNAHILHTGVKGITEMARSRMVAYFMNSSPTDIVVVDNGADIVDDVSVSLLKRADLVFIVSNNSPKCKDRVKQWLKSPTLKNMDNVYVILNQYNEVLGAARNLAKEFDITPNRFCKMHYNPWVPAMCSVGHLQDVVSCAMRWDPRTANLVGDLNEIYQCFESAIFTKRGK